MRETIQDSVAYYMRLLAPAFRERGVSIVRYQYGRGLPTYVAVENSLIEDQPRAGLVLVKIGRDTRWVPMEVLWGKKTVITE
jgi:hypothetical protein